jgi:gamma-F420-2:alpha-L-glutamate ligase
MKTGWLLYEDGDLKQNQDFADYVTAEGKKFDMDIRAARVSQLEMGAGSDGALTLRLGGRAALPDFVISRQRDELTSLQLERMGVPVFNGSRVCGICNDKRRTHQFLAGLPMMETRFVGHRYAVAPGESAYPLVVKPARGHGGQNVELVRNEYEWQEAADEIMPDDIVEQKPASEAGRDLRVYVLFGEIVASVMRTAREGIVSNFKRGGQVELHTLTGAERALAEKAIARFQEADAPLCLAGVDLLYDRGRPVLNEVEDVVGSRMLYKVSDIDIVKRYLSALRERL